MESNSLSPFLHLLIVFDVAASLLIRVPHIFRCITFHDSPGCAGISPGINRGYSFYSFGHMGDWAPRNLQGNKPDFHIAMLPQKAKPFYASLVDRFRNAYSSDAIKGVDVEHAATKDGESNRK